MKYVGLDVHRDTISVVVLEESGKMVMQTILATHAAALLDFVGGLSGSVHITFEEGTHSAWLYNFRRLVSRWEYHEANFLGILQLACLIILPRHL